MVTFTKIHISSIYFELLSRLHLKTSSNPTALLLTLFSPSACKKQRPQRNVSMVCDVHLLPLGVRVVHYIRIAAPPEQAAALCANVGETPA